MPKRTAALKTEQPDLLGNAPQTAKPVAKIEPKPKGKTKTELTVVASDKPKTLIERLREVSNGTDVAVAREILAMIRSEEDRQAARLFNEAMLACQSELPPIIRDSHNKHTNSKWAKLEKISRICDPIIRKHGFTLSYGMATSHLADHYRVICDVSHLGFTRRYEADVGMDSKGPKGEGNKSLAQGSGSSVTYARRYLKVMIFDIVIEGEDNDGNVSRQAARTNVIDGEVLDADDSVPKINQAQHDQLVEAVEDCGVSRKKFCEVYRIKAVADLPAEMFAVAMKACADYKAKK